MASTPVEPDLGPHTGELYTTSTSIVPQFRDADDEEPDPPAGKRFPVVGLLIIVALAVIAVLVSVTFARFLDPPTRDVRATDGPAGPPVPPGPQYTVTGPLGATRTAEFQLVAGVTAIAVTTADLGDNLYRASTEPGSSFVPRVVQEGDTVQLRVANVVDKGSDDTVTVQLNQRVNWRINLVGGSESATVDLRSGTPAGIDFTGGVARIEVWLPKPQGAVSVKMSGGARDVVVHAAKGVPVRVLLTRGAATTTVDGTKRTGVVAGTKIVPAGWDAARDKYTIDAAGGLASLTVDR